jgi:hypothetical protein|tara:strand:+ start:7271 stop:7372 length:102 start_codon:yes stop_codon:yes gene_type:complete
VISKKQLTVVAALVLIIAVGAVILASTREPFGV